MYHMNSLLDKAVINQATGERLATVEDVVFSKDMRAIIALLIKGSGWFSSPCVVRWGTVRSIGDVIVAQSEGDFPRLNDDRMINELSQAQHKITGTPVIGPGGERAGTVSDVLINERGIVLGYEINQGLLSGHKFLPVAQVQTAGRDAIIVSDATLMSMKEAEQNGGVPQDRSVGEL